MLPFPWRVVSHSHQRAKSELSFTNLDCIFLTCWILTSCTTLLRVFYTRQGKESRISLAWTHRSDMLLPTWLVAPRLSLGPIQYLSRKHGRTSAEVQMSTLIYSDAVQIWQARVSASQAEIGTNGRSRKNDRIRKGYQADIRSDIEKCGIFWPCLLTNDNDIKDCFLPSINIVCLNLLRTRTVPFSVSDVRHEGSSASEDLDRARVRPGSVNELGRE